MSAIVLNEKFEEASKIALPESYKVTWILSERSFILLSRASSILEIRPSGILYQIYDFRRSTKI